MVAFKCTSIFLVGRACTTPTVTTNMKHLINILSIASELPVISLDIQMHQVDCPLYSDLSQYPDNKTNFLTRCSNECQKTVIVYSHALCYFYCMSTSTLCDYYCTHLAQKDLITLYVINKHSMLALCSNL